MNPHLRKAIRARKAQQAPRPVAIVLGLGMLEGVRCSLQAHGLTNRAGREATLAGLVQLRDLVTTRHTLAIHVAIRADDFKLSLYPIASRPLGDGELDQLRRLVKEAAVELGIELA